MSIFAFFKRSCMAFSFLLLMACGGHSHDDGATLTEQNISLSESSYDFGGIVVGNNADYTFVITNTGEADLAIGQISSSGSTFSISDDACSNTTLADSETCSVRARFSPIAQGENQQGALSIPSNDPDQSTATVALNGEGHGLNVWINKVTVAGCAITVDMTVTDPKNIVPLDSLEKANFTLCQNGSELPDTFDVGAIESPVHASVVLAVDWSNSELGAIEGIQTAAKSFIGQLTADDEAAICKFNSAIEIDPGTPSFYAGTNPALADYIDSTFSNANGTFLYDAVYASIERATHGTAGKQRAVVVLSDGVDLDIAAHPPGSTHTLDEVIAYGIQEEIPIFSIFYFDPDFQEGYSGDPEVMQSLSQEAGEFYNGTTADNLTDIYQQISNVLNNKYTITYTSSTCSGTVSLVVRAEESGLYGQDSRSITFTP